MAVDAQQLHGIYRGIVVDTRDPLGMNRYRVHVGGGVDTQLLTKTTYDATLESTASEKTDFFPLNYDVWEIIQAGDGGDYVSDNDDYFRTYPWAEVAAWTTKGGGFTPVFTVGDLVWVMYEFGDHSYPVIVGGWTSTSFQIPDLTPEKGAAYQPDTTIDSSDDVPYPSGDEGAPYVSYDYSRFRWSVTDNRGGIFEMSEVPDESWTRLGAGSADLYLDMLNDSMEVDAQGAALFTNPTFVFYGQSFYAVGETEVILQVFGDAPVYEPPGGSGSEPSVGIEPIMGLYSTWDTDIYAADELAIGQYLTRESAPDRNVRKQTRFAWIGAKDINVGVASPDPWLHNSTYPLDVSNTTYREANFTPTDHVRVEAEQQVIVRSTGGPQSTYATSSCPTYCSDLEAGDIFLWAKNKIILRADNGIEMCPPLTVTGAMIPVFVKQNATSGNASLTGNATATDARTYDIYALSDTGSTLDTGKLPIGAPTRMVFGSVTLAGNFTYGMAFQDTGSTWRLVYAFSETRVVAAC